MSKKSREAHEESQYLLTFAVCPRIHKICRTIEDTLQNQLGVPTPSSVGPHITIKPPFTLNHIRLKRRRGAVQGMIKKMAADKAFRRIGSVIGPLDYFANSEGTIIHLPFLEEQNKDLYKLARHAISELVGHGVRPAFYDGKRLHITLARRLNEDTHGAAWELISTCAPAGSMAIEGVVVHEKLKGGIWKEVSRHPLPVR